MRGKIVDCGKIVVIEEEEEGEEGKEGEIRGRMEAMLTG